MWPAEFKLEFTRLRGQSSQPSILQVVRDAMHAAEQNGIVFIDEIDKIVSPSGSRIGGQPALLTYHTAENQSFISKL